MSGETLGEVLLPAAKRQRTMQEGAEVAPGPVMGGAGVEGLKQGLSARALEPAGPEQQQLGRQQLIGRTEFLRLVQQSIRSLGFAEVASQLEAQSGVRCQDTTVDALQAAVVAGDWERACACLERLRGQLPQGVAAQAQFLLVEHKYREALHCTDIPAALACLREELRPLAAASAEGAGAERLHQLAALLLYASPANGVDGSGACSGSDSGSRLANGTTVAARQVCSGSGTLAAEGVREEGAGGVAAVAASGDAKAAASRPPCCQSSTQCGGCGGGGTCAALAHLRQSCLARLGAVLPPAVLLPPRRLEALVEQALQWQLERCPLHNTPGLLPSLLADHSCGMEQVPTVVTQVLTEHRDEVWHLAFSPTGAMLASASKDGCAVVYDVRGRGAVAARHTLRKHAGAVAFLCWSPDGSQLATCGQDGSVRVWDAAEGHCVASLLHHTDAVTSCAWLPDGQSLVTGSHDKQMCQVEVATGRVLRRWHTARVQDLLVAKGGRYVLATTSERRVRVFDLLDEGREEQVLQERDTIISMALSQDSRYLLLNLTCQELHLWDLGPGPELRSLPSLPCATYSPGPHELRSSRYVVRACLGGLQQRFVLTGSEECKVFLYHRHTGQLLAELEAHTGTVNAVSWNPADPHMFASASDDRTVQIWGVAAAVEAQAQL